MEALLQTSSLAIDLWSTISTICASDSSHQNILIGHYTEAITQSYIPNILKNSRQHNREEGFTFLFKDRALSSPSKGPIDMQGPGLKEHLHRSLSAQISNTTQTACLSSAEKKTQRHKSERRQ